MDGARGTSGWDVTKERERRVSQEMEDRYRGLLKAYEDAEAAGLGAVMYGDIHIDKAHADKATAWLARVDALAALHGGI